MSRRLAVWGLAVLALGCRGRIDKAGDAPAAPAAKPVEVGAAQEATSAKPGDRLASEPARTFAFDAFHAGFSERDITPTKQLVLAGYGTYTYPFGRPRENIAGTHDPLKASAVAFASRTGKPFVLVGVDSVGLSSASVSRIRNRVEERLGSARFHLVVSASHSHSTPDSLGLWGQLPLSGRDQAYMKTLESAVADAALGALDSLVPAKVAVARGAAPNSTSGMDGVRKDDSFVYLLVQDLQGRSLGTLTQWAAHPTVLGEGNNAVSADFVGAYRHFLSEKVSGTHVYVNGAIGNVYPVETLATVEDPFVGGARDPDAGEDYSLAAAVARELLVRVEAAEAVPEFIDGIDVCRVPFAMPIRNGSFLQAVTAGVVEHPLDNGAAPTEISIVKLGGVRFASFPAEVFPSVGNEIRGLVGGEGATVVPVGLANDWLGYVMSELEAADTKLAYWKGLSPSPDAGRILVESFAGAAKGEGCQ